MTQQLPPGFSTRALGRTAWIALPEVEITRSSVYDPVLKPKQAVRLADALLSPGQEPPEGIVLLSHPLMTADLADEFVEALRANLRERGLHIHVGLALDATQEDVVHPAHAPPEPESSEPESAPEPDLPPEPSLDRPAPASLDEPELDPLRPVDPAGETQDFLDDLPELVGAPAADDVPDEKPELEMPELEVPELEPSESEPPEPKRPEIEETSAPGDAAPGLEPEVLELDFEGEAGAVEEPGVPQVDLGAEATPEPEEPPDAGLVVPPPEPAATPEPELEAPAAPDVEAEPAEAEAKPQADGEEPEPKKRKRKKIEAPVKSGKAGKAGSSDKAKAFAPMRKRKHIRKDKK